MENIILSGFYMITARDEVDAKQKTKEIFEDEIRISFEDRFGEIDFNIIDVEEIVILELDEGKEFDVHFTLELWDVEKLEEDTDMFHIMEMMMCTGLGIVDTELAS